MRPKQRLFIADKEVGKRTATKCSGEQTETELSSSNASIRGLYKVAAVKSDYWRATNYSCCWVNDHKTATAKWRSAGILCYDIVGYKGPPYFNPIYRTRIEYVKNLRPLATGRFPLQYLTLGAIGSANDVVTPSGQFEKLRSSLNNALLNKIKDQKAMSLVSLAEAGKTVSLARSLSSDVLKAMLFVAKGIVQPKSVIDEYLKYARRNGLRPPRKSKSLRSTNFKFIKNMQKHYKKHPADHNRLLKGIPQTASSRWLEYRYGIGPLLADMSAAHDYVYTQWYKYINNNRIVVKYRTFGAGSVGSTTGNDNFGYLQCTTEWLAQYISSFTISNQIARHAQKTGFSPAELLATAWELIPFSFVFDWFYNLGDTISALSATIGLSHLQTSFSLKETAKGTIRVSGTSADLTQIEKPSGNDGSVEYGGFLRKTYNLFPLPTLPTLQFPFDSIFDKRVFDSLSLLMGGFNKKQLTYRGA